MNCEQTKNAAELLLNLLSTAASPEEIAEVFSEDVDWVIPGDSDALPWIGKKTGRSAVVDFVSSTRRLLEPLRFEVVDILASETRAGILGELASRVKSSGRVIETPFCIALTFVDGKITRFLMLEDSFAVHEAACLD